ncbi:hypothetical protein [Staphylococcus hominis]|mgnify:CR=1 FL=1|uniref:hypothetical protein n=1 Tax=Staphylococcus hominis TaxID=1290 RepID=UPI0014741753|nr:hypothetical protein [Staphylococcus hominis]MDS3837842.1 hypothetical protein [Staphylococcus hominis]NMD91140.1 hypothetical protein [Staphylococcus hominis]
MNEFKSLANIYPPDLPRAVKGWDHITKQYLYYFKHNTPNGIYEFWYDDNGNFVYEKINRKEEIDCIQKKQY